MQSRTPLVYPVVIVALILVAGFAIQPARAVNLGQIDDFEDGSTKGWSEGGPSPNPPTNVASGGPDGVDDNYLADTSTGTGTAGSKMVMSNSGRWSGDYVSEGIQGIKMMMANFGNAPLQMRIALLGPSSSRYGSMTAFTLPADGAWHPVVFGLTVNDLGYLGGVATPVEVLAAVETLRILAASSGPAWKGDTIAASIGIDDIEAIAVSVDAKSVSLSALKTSFGQH